VLPLAELPQKDRKRVLVELVGERQGVESRDERGGRDGGEAGGAGGAACDGAAGHGGEEGPVRDPSASVGERERGLLARRAFTGEGVGNGLEADAVEEV
jgi:hypothetical protein